jgi:Ca2+-binding EF-hand superfamily protein
MNTDKNNLKKEINVLISASNNEDKINICQYLCNYDFGDDRRSEIYKNNFNDYEIIYFLNTSICNYYDAMIIFCNDENELNSLRDEANNIIKTIPTKLIIATFSIKETENFIFFNYTKSTAEEISKGLINAYLSNFEKIKQIFLKFDEDKSGYIESCEINLLAKALGQDTKSDRFKKALLALDSNNDDKISLDEFTDWWKRKDDAEVLSTLKDVTKQIDESVYEYLLFNNLKKESKKKLRQKIINLDVNINNIKENTSVESRLCLRLGLGQFESRDSSKNYLSKFSDDLSYSNRDWFAFGFFIKPNTLPKEEFNKLLTNFSENFISLLDKLFFDNPTQNFFINNFSKIFYWDIKIYELSANLILNFKHDITGLVKSNLENIILLKNFLSGLNSSFYRRRSGVNLELDLTSTKNILDLKISKFEEIKKFSEIEFRGHYDVNKLQFLIKNLNRKVKGSNDYSSLTNDQINNEEFLNLMKNFNFEKIIQFVTKIKSIINPELCASTSRLEFSLNLFDIFFNMEF